MSMSMSMSMSTNKTFLTALQWLSPAFPIGGFAYSHGLEWAIEKRHVTDQISLQNWLQDLLGLGSARSDAILIALAFKSESKEELIYLNQLALALSASAERRSETLLQGQAFGKTIRDVWGQDCTDLCYPVALGAAARRENLIKDGRFAGREQWVTVLISDTCSFTGLSEQLPPSGLMQWLNRGISIGVQAVTSRGGMVNKFTGDGMLAVFGAPVSSGADVDAANAVAAALAIQQQIVDLNRSLSEEGQPAMRIRIGIHSGTVLTGSLGSSERLEYAVIGDTVNCASRLESLHKERHKGVVRVLLSSETKNLLTGLPPKVYSVPWGAISVNGRQEPLEVIELKSTSQ